MLSDLIRLLEALADQAWEEQKSIPKNDRSKETLSYFEGKKAGLELAVFKVRTMERGKK